MTSQTHPFPLYIAITGHRPHKLGNDYNLTSPMVMKIKKSMTSILGELHLKNGSEIILITGMALGIDTLFAKMAIENDIPFIAAIPFKGQERLWNESSKAEYRFMLQLAKEIVICDINERGSYSWYSNKPETPFSRTKMQTRNEWMVDNCDHLIAVWDGSAGGTANCVAYADQQKRDVIRINPFWFTITT